MKRIAILLMCLLACDAYAQQQRIPDLSMSPAETNKLLRGDDTQDGDVGVNPNDHEQHYDSDKTTGDDDSGYAPQEFHAAAPAGSFMSGYCDPNFKPLITKSSSLRSCLATERQQTCNEFHHMPQDVRTTLDTVIGCAQSDSDEDTPHDIDDCANSDTERMQLLKKYFQNESVTHALTFLPDEVMNASRKCTHGGN